MKKLILSVFLILSLAVLLSCGYKLSAPTDNAAEKNRQEEEEISHSFVGSYTKDMGIMGKIYGGHLVNLYEDGRAKINFAFFGGLMGGSSHGTYEGTYTLENGLLRIAYVAEDKDRSFEAEVRDGSFRGQLVLGMSATPDDKTDEEHPGLTYFEIPKTAFTNSGRVFFGAARTEDGYCAQVLELNHTTESGEEGDFSLTVASGDCVGEVSGSFVKKDKKLTFVYDVPAVSDREILSIVLTEDFTLETTMVNEYVVETNFNIGNIDSDIRPTLVMGKN